MNIKKIPGIISFRRLLIFIILFAIGIQLIVIGYNHYSGYYVLEDVQHFIRRLFRGSILSFIAGFLISYPDLIFIKYLNNVVSWSQQIFKRIIFEFLFAVLLAVVISIVITLFANWLKPYTEDLAGVLINNALIYSVVNIILMAVYEGWIFYLEGREARKEAKNLQEELAQIKYEVLKSQINPHFMFNSLNVLSGLVNRDKNKAQQFIDEFSHIYRYVLETIEQPVTTLSEELDFMRSYLFLQMIRYGDSLKYTVDIPAQIMNYYLPPLSLQVVLENAIKHNIVNESKPLTISISFENMNLIVKNDIQPKISGGKSTGLGLKNLAKRYAMISEKEPIFKVDTNHYIAKLPLIKTEENESFDN